VLQIRHQKLEALCPTTVENIATLLLTLEAALEGSTCSLRNFSTLIEHGTEPSGEDGAEMSCEFALHGLDQGL
jgi:hypothetical protein